VGLLGGLVLGVCALADARADAADIVANDIEVTQSIQDLDNGVRLVQGKRTYVRFHVMAVLGPIQNVNAVLAAGRIGGPGPIGFLGTLQPLNPGGKITVVNVPRREDLDDSFYFELPPSWRSGTVQVFASADPLGDIPESNNNNNTLFETVTFEAVPPSRVLLFDVKTPGSQLPSAVDHERFESWMRAAYPISKLLVETRQLDTMIDWDNDVCNCNKVNGNCQNVGTCANAPAYPCDADLDCGCGRLNDQLAKLRASDQINQDDFEPDRRYVGWVDDSGGFMRGCSPGVVQKVASGPVGVQLQSQTWDTDGSYADWYTAHELGHTYDRAHATCCGALPNPGDPVFPYPMCRLSDGSHYGFDVRDLRIYRSLVPGSFSELMSYCSSQWVSDFTYEGIMQQLIDEEGAPAPPPLGPGNFVLVQADTNEDLDKVQLRTVQVLPNILSPFPVHSTGDYAIEIRDAAGGVLATFFAQSSPTIFEAANVPPGEPLVGPPLDETRSILEVVPLPANAFSVVIKKGGVDLDEKSASANAPVVTIQSPNGGEILSDPATVTWTASDADNDPLTFTLLYSSDGGMNWTTIATDLAGNVAQVPLAGLPGGASALFRVIVSDGFLTGQDDSDAVFSVPNSPPVVRILSPGDATAYRQGTILSLEADATDAEDGPLDGASVVWTSARRGVLGSGAILELPVLFTGEDVITVTATDSAGASASASTRIELAVDPVEAPAASPIALALAVVVLAATAALALARRESV
jgi:hypothetical protein